MPKRVVIVDDSATMRRWLRYHLDADPRLNVVGEASEARSARKVIKQTEPDVITLDIEMPGMNGLAFLERLMRLRPLPVVMISSATRQGSDAAVHALSLGAVDCLLKPHSSVAESMTRDIARRVFSAACSHVSTPMKPERRSPSLPANPMQGSGAIILLGASTGGVTALETVLGTLNPVGPPVVIVQHMPGTFLVSFTSMLDRVLPQSVGLLSDGEVLHPGQVRFAPELGGQHASVTRCGDNWRGKLTPAPTGSLHCPSIDALFASAEEMAIDVIAGLLTGLGQDGAEGLKRLRDAGARTLGQDATSCVVYGMPRAAFELGAVEQQEPLNTFGSAINQLVMFHRIRNSGGAK